MPLDRGGDGELAVGGGEQPERDEGPVPWPALPAGEGVGRHVGAKKGEGAVVHGDVDEVAGSGLAGSVDRRHEAEGHQGAGVDVGNGDLVEITGGLHETAHGLAGGVEARPGPVRAGPGTVVAEAAHGGVHNPGVASSDDLVPESEIIHHAGSHVLDDGVGPFTQSKECLGVCGLFEVEAHAPLVAVDPGKGHSVVGPCVGPARGVSVVGRVRG